MAVAVVVAAAFYAIGASAMQIRSNVDACQCLNWQETYAAQLAQCGQGFEFTRALGYPKAKYGTAEEWLQVVQNKDALHSFQSSMGAEFCESFYKRFDDTKCARTAMDHSFTEWYGKSWCYVSKECSSAMAVADAQVSVKLCEEGKDSLLSDMEPNALMAYGRKMGFYVPGYFVKVSYPVVREFFYDTATSTQLDDVKDTPKFTGKVMLVDKIDEHQDKMIIAPDGRVYDMPNSYDGFRCTEGCDIYSFAPKDGLICYQGPQDAMETLYYKVRQGMNQLMFVNSTLWSSPCTDHGFTMNFLGQTCYGNTFVNTDKLQPHVDDENFYSTKFMQEHSKEEIEKAQALMGCASCHPHC